METKLGGSAKNKEQREGVRRAPSLACFFAHLFDLRLEKERKQLLRRLQQGLM